jgi:SAM-dependent methyltransferase
MISSASLKKTNDIAFNLISLKIHKTSKVLDLGAGRGYLARRIGKFMNNSGINFKKFLLAADISRATFEAKEVPFKKCNFNKELPFASGSYDLIYSIEVIEHLRSPYDFLAECSRILKPGGYLVLSTPNTLHLASRLKFFFNGFFELYEPPSIDPKNAGRLCGHIMPLNIAYYDYGLRLCGLKNMSIYSDKEKTKSKILYFLLFPFLKIIYWRFKNNLKKYDLSVFNENINVLNKLNSRVMLTSRSLFFVVQKI